MSITAKKITTTTVLKGVSPSSKALPVISNDFNPVIDDLTSQDARIANLEDGTIGFAEHITDTTDTTSGATGALIVDGGVGIAKKLYIADSTDSTTKDTGSIITDGGLGVEKAITAGTTITATTRLFTGAGTVSAPSLVIGATDNGLYEVSGTQIGFSMTNALVGGFDASGLYTNAITEQTTGSGITLSKNIIRKNTLTALNSTGTITAAMVQKGGITSTSAAAVAATLDTAANIATAIGAVQGTSIEFLVDNTAGANTVTVVVAAGIVAATPIITGGATLTVAASATQGIGIFRLVFSSASAAVLYRIG